MTTAKHHLADLTSASTDADIARAICGYLLNTENPLGPFKLAYQHDAANSPPPHQCDRIFAKKLCAVERKDKEWSRQWILDALGKGLYVQRYAGDSFYRAIAGGSIKQARDTIEARERMNAFDATRTLRDDDDEIPF